MRTRWVAGVACLAGAVVMAFGGVAEAAPGRWRVLPSPNVGTLSNGLGAVAALSRSEAWAVGTSQTTSGTDFLTLAEHWDGSAWTVAATPNGGTLNGLNGVAEIADDDAWAVGVDYNQSAQAYQTLVEHWDGAAWTIVPSPNRGTRYDALQAVDALGPSDIWAVGMTQTSGPTIRNLTLVEHWDGAAWTVVPSPDRPGETDAWLLGVSAISSGDVWATGFDHTGTLTEHWDGTSWKIEASPNPAGAFAELPAVAALGPSDVWAVGDSRLTGGSSRTLTEHWDGASWKIVPSPTNGSLNNFLAGVTALSPGDVWAVGTYVKQLTIGSANRTLIEHWNGRGWTIVDSPSPGPEDVLLGSAAAGPSAVLAVGGFTGQTGAQRTLILVNSRA